MRNVIPPKLRRDMYSWRCSARKLERCAPDKSLMKLSSARIRCVDNRLAIARLDARVTRAVN